MPWARCSDQNNLGNRRAGMGQHDHRRHRSYRCCRVHDHAQRTLIRIAVQRMNVRDLNKDNQRKQKNAKQGSYPHQSVWALVLVEHLHFELLHVEQITDDDSGGCGYSLEYMG